MSFTIMTALKNFTFCYTEMESFGIHSVLLQSIPGPITGFHLLLL